MNFKRSFQPKPFCDSGKRTLSDISMHSSHWGYKELLLQKCTVTSKDFLFLFWIKSLPQRYSITHRLHPYLTDYQEHHRCPHSQPDSPLPRQLLQTLHPYNSAPWICCTCLCGQGTTSHDLTSSSSISFAYFTMFTFLPNPSTFTSPPNGSSLLSWILQ